MLSVQVVYGEALVRLILVPIAATAIVAEDDVTVKSTIIGAVHTLLASSDVQILSN